MQFEFDNIPLTSPPHENSDYAVLAGREPSLHNRCIGEDWRARQHVIPTQFLVSQSFHRWSRWSWSAGGRLWLQGTSLNEPAPRYKSGQYVRSGGTPEFDQLCQFSFWKSRLSLDVVALASMYVVLAASSLSAELEQWNCNWVQVSAYTAQHWSRLVFLSALGRTSSRKRSQLRIVRHVSQCKIVSNFSLLYRFLYCIYLFLLQSHKLYQYKIYKYHLTNIY